MTLSTRRSASSRVRNELRRLLSVAHPIVCVCVSLFVFSLANVFFRNYEVKGNADRLLVYMTLYTTQCLEKLQKCSSKNDVRAHKWTAHSFLSLDAALLCRA